MENWITEFMSEFGYIGVLLLIMLENIFPPIPSEVILTFGGFMTTYSNMTVIGVIIAATIGSVVGAMLLYSIGLLIDVHRLEKIVDRWGKYLRLTRKDIHRADAWFDKYGPWTVFFCRLIPLIRSLISIPAGMSNMNFPLFILLTTLGSLLWNGILVMVGVSVGENWQSIVEYMDIFSNVVYVLIGISGLLVILWYVRFRRKRA
ncbi:DedA family protein [Sporosarcina pasteurii]|uniref:SNARE associated Golgi protein n=2 Tax=Sporosarcina pasteurii TaxID=1474 RepID=A0A380BBX0_SPOPA|nr:DedA family protein [Sporosarcina pasteurii]MDS9472434.1 DedA family protein [Sporosarcina pasteurii]SUI98845.1 SNARE associated Golgi protein [Sporosarcina pasteurii]